ncbi:hypothetical protein P9B03_01445 [Metasolibacillus meyeri]|uniref:YesK-like protein n=1 Tax=Metasolibacillus meyeri TaxID=1071052 RepID=A0AAW9NI88_9BACL|nr:hypothetical protein [Metasolibacillus meyeri]MEC1177135.1 hypothetical protein [Metasolibacillus meyeri]
MDLKYLPLLLSALFLFVVTYLERNQEQKSIKKPTLLVGILMIFYILLMSLDYSFMAAIIGIIGLLILIISLIIRIFQRITSKRK